MGILGFGKVKKLEDLDIKELRRERITQEVRQDQLLARMRHSQEQYDVLLELASEPGLSDGEVDAAAYKMTQVSKTKDRSEQDLQQVLVKMSVIDSTLDVIGQKTELQKKGIWKKINEIPEEQLESQLEELAIERKEGRVNVDRIAEVFDVDRQAVRSQRSGEFGRAREAILQRREEKDS